MNSSVISDEDVAALPADNRERQRQNETASVKTAPDQADRTRESRRLVASRCRFVVCAFPVERIPDTLSIHLRFFVRVGENRGGIAFSSSLSP